MEAMQAINACDINMQYMAAVMMSVLLSYYLYYLHLIVLAALVSRIAGPMGFSRSALSMFYSCSAENIAQGNSTTIFTD